MIALGGSLTAAQKTKQVKPYIGLSAYERSAEGSRLRWTRLYTGSEGAHMHAGAVASDGAVLRAYTYNAGGGTWNLRYQRIASPSSSSAWSTWTALVTNISIYAGPAICSKGSNVFIYYVDVDEVTIKVKQSTDSGATFGAAATVATAPGGHTIVYLGASTYSSGNYPMLFYATTENTIYSVKRNSSSVWGAPAAWSNSVGYIAGLACTRNVDTLVVVTGEITEGAKVNVKVWTCLFGDGGEVGVGVWSALMVLTAAEPAADVNLTYTWPSAATSSAMDYAVYREVYTGTGAYTQNQISYNVYADTILYNCWREPYPVQPDETYGLDLAIGASKAYLLYPAGVWESPVGVAEVDLKADLMSLVWGVDVEGKEELTAIISSAGGKYLPANGGKGINWLGANLLISLGYYYTGGHDSSSHLDFWVESYRYETPGGRGTLVLKGTGPWGILSSWRSHRQITWISGSTSVYEILKYILARAGGFTLGAESSSSAIDSWKPAFTVTPGESGAEVVRRLMATVPDTLHFRNKAAIVHERSASNASVYAYGPASHPIIGGEYITQALDVNRVQVYGASVFGEAVDNAQIDLMVDRLKQVHDRNITLAADAAARAAELLRDSQLELQGEVIDTFPNCGLEVYDVIDLTESQAGYSATKRRVRSIKTRYVPGKGTYLQEVICGAT